MAKYTAKGTLLKIEDDALAGSFITIAQLTSIGGPEQSREQVESTALDSVGGYREFLPGMRDGGEMPIEGQFDPSGTGQLELLQNLQDEDVARNFEMVLPTATGKKFTFKAFVNQFSVSASTEDILGFSASLKITGKVSLVAA